MMIGAYLESVAQALRDAGLAATTDPRNAHPPCALVVPRTVTPRSGCLVRVGVEVLLIAPGPGNGDALAWLDEALATAWAAMPLRWPAQLVEFVSPHMGTPLLAWSLERDEDMLIPPRITPLHLEASHG